MAAYGWLRRGAVTCAAVALAQAVLARPARSAERVVLGEEFTATW